MSSRKKSKGKGGSGGAPDEAKTKAGSSQVENDVVRENGERGGEVGGGGLKGFVGKMEGQTHRMVEMRLAVVAACGVAFRVLYYDNLENADTAWSVLSLVVGEGRY